MPPMSIFEHNKKHLVHHNSRGGIMIQPLAQGPVPMTSGHVMTNANDRLIHAISRWIPAPEEDQ